MSATGSYEIPPALATPSALPEEILTGQGSWRMRGGTHLLIDVPITRTNPLLPWLATWKDRSPTWVSPPEGTLQMTWGEGESFAQALQAFLASAPEGTGLFWPGPAIGFVPGAHLEVVALMIANFSQEPGRFAVVDTHNLMFIRWVHLQNADPVERVVAFHFCRGGHWATQGDLYLDRCEAVQSEETWDRVVIKIESARYAHKLPR